MLAKEAEKTEIHIEAQALIITSYKETAALSMLTLFLFPM